MTVTEEAAIKQSCIGYLDQWSSEEHGRDKPDEIETTPTGMGLRVAYLWHDGKKPDYLAVTCRA